MTNTKANALKRRRSTIQSRRGWFKGRLFILPWAIKGCCGFLVPSMVRRCITPLNNESCRGRHDLRISGL